MTEAEAHAEIERLTDRRIEIRRLEFAALNHVSERAMRQKLRWHAEDSDLMTRLRELMAQFPN